MIHDLKTWPLPFQAIFDGRKTHEIRKQDRPFAAGDQLLLREWNGGLGGYTGREAIVDVTYVTDGGEWGLPDGLCVMSIRRQHGISTEQALAEIEALKGALRTALDAWEMYMSEHPADQEEDGSLLVDMRKRFGLDGDE